MGGAARRRLRGPSVGSNDRATVCTAAGVEGRSAAAASAQSSAGFATASPSAPGSAPSRRRASASSAEAGPACGGAGRAASAAAHAARSASTAPGNADSIASRVAGTASQVWSARENGSPAVGSSVNPSRREVHAHATRRRYARRLSSGVGGKRQHCREQDGVAPPTAVGLGGLHDQALAGERAGEELQSLPVVVETTRTRVAAPSRRRRRKAVRVAS